MDEIRRGDVATIERDSEELHAVEERESTSRRSRQAERMKDRTSADDGRGRSAADIPARGWKDILLRVYRGISDDRILANAAAVTFYALLALFPAIAALVSICGLFADPGSIQQHLDAVIPRPPAW